MQLYAWREASRCAGTPAPSLSSPSWIPAREPSRCATCPNGRQACRDEVCAGNPIVTRTTCRICTDLVRRIAFRHLRAARWLPADIESRCKRLCSPAYQAGAGLRSRNSKGIRIAWATAAARSLDARLRRSRRPGGSLSSPRPSRSAFDPRSGPCGRYRHWACRADAKSASPRGRPAR